MSKWSLLIPLAGLTLSPVALAMQQANTENEQQEQAQVDENIQVTGSRLKGVDMEGANPVQIFSQEDLNQRGHISIGSFLKDLPQAATAGTFTENGGVGGADGAPAGSAGVSLRGLGSSSTLVLVNGRRVNVSSFANGADSFVNVNNIPMSAIERIEVLTDGASSIYGSDAIAGVINFIMRKDFEGHEVSLMYGDDTNSADGSRYNATYVGGFNTKNSNTTVILDYASQNSVFNSDRPIDVTFESSTFVDIDGTEYAEPYCNDGTAAANERCNYDYVIQRVIQPDFDNFGATVNHFYRLDDHTEFFAEAMFQRNEGHAYDSGAAFSANIPGDSPVVPEWASEINEADGSTDPIYISSRFPDRRTQEYTDTSYRMLAGLRGEIGFWSWETAASYGKSESEILHTAGFYSVDAVDEAIADGRFDPFNLGRNNDASTLANLRTLAPRNGESELFSIDFNISGDLFEIPAGYVKSVFGGEYRREELFDEPAAIASNNGVFALGASQAEADRSQYAFYGEFHLPLTQSIDAIAALRYDHYSDFGGDVNPKLSLRWRATDDLILRASASTGFRAPSLTQLGAGTSLSAAYINCTPDDPYVSLCGTSGNEQGELELDQETLGNLDLEAEKSVAYNMGVSWNITDAWQFTADYWRYDHEDIVDIDANTTLDACVAGTSPVVSDESELNNEFGCVVNAEGDLVFLRTGYFNVGEQKTDGVDIRTDYSLSSTQYGKFNFYASGTRTFSYERKLTADSEAEDLLGRLSGAAEIARPEFVADFGVEWQFSDYDANLNGHYVSSLGDGDFKFGGNETVDAWLTWNASVGYQLNENHRFLLTVRNLLDEEPPYASSPTNGYASSVHDWLGRQVSLRYTANF
ncbi:MAG: TonB-dependent receptor plug domain-containing protein [Pseudomonadota bacterium]